MFEASINPAQDPFGDRKPVRWASPNLASDYEAAGKLNCLQLIIEPEAQSRTKSCFKGKYYAALRDNDLSGFLTGRPVLAGKKTPINWSQMLTECPLTHYLWEVYSPSTLS